MQKEISSEFIKNWMINHLGDYLDDCYADLFGSLFCTRLWITGQYTANTALMHFKREDGEDENNTLDGPMGAIKLVQDYLLTNLGKVNIDLTDPEAVANQVAIIRASKIFQEILDKADMEASDVFDENDIKHLVNILKSLD